MRVIRMVEHYAVKKVVNDKFGILRSSNCIYKKVNYLVYFIQYVDVIDKIKNCYMQLNV